MNKKTKKVDLRVTGELYEQLRHHSKKTDTPVARIIRTLLTSHLLTA